MNIAVIGGGFTGLTGAHELLKRGHQVTLFEKEASLGGLAAGWKEPHWDWYLEKAYHHLFTNDRAILSLIHELSLSEKLIVKRSITATLWNEKIYQLDSPASLLQFPGLSVLSRFRTALLLGLFKLTPIWQPLERLTTQDVARGIGGTQGWEVIWKPLMYGKFDTYAEKIAASWFWARIKKRTPKLCYIEGGFNTLISALENAIVNHGGVININTSVVSISKSKNQKVKIQIKYQKEKNAPIIESGFDKVLLTIPTPLAIKIVPQLPPSYYQVPMSIPHLHAQVLVLETKQPILACPEPSRGVYWLNITDRSFPFLAVVAHTNFIDKKHYGNHHLTYIGNYLPQGHPYLSMSAKKLLSIFLPYINQLMNHESRIVNKGNFKTKFHNSKFVIHNSYLFVGPFAQPIHELRYSQKAPKLHTPIPGVYLANMDSIYPWDRGTNYAVELGKKAATTIHNER